MTLSLFCPNKGMIVAKNRIFFQLLNLPLIEQCVIYQILVRDGNKISLD